MFFIKRWKAVFRWVQHLSIYGTMHLFQDKDILRILIGAISLGVWINTPYVFDVHLNKLSSEQYFGKFQCCDF